MCWVENICLCVPLNIGCVLIGVINIILSTIMLTIALIHLMSDKHMLEIETSSPEQNVNALFSVNLTASAVTILAYVVLLFGVLCILTSILLIVGIYRNNSSCVLVYFFFGIILTILCQLGALLVLLSSCWGLSLVIFLVSLVYIHFQVAVYTVYDLMQQGKDFRFQKLHYEDDDALLSFGE